MGVVARTFTVRGKPVTRLLCTSHNQQADDGSVSWLTGPPPTRPGAAGPVPFSLSPPGGAAAYYADILEGGISRSRPDGLRWGMPNG
jgi:hypothetical protein